MDNTYTVTIKTQIPARDSPPIDATLTLTIPAPDSSAALFCAGQIAHALALPPPSTVNIAKIEE